ncbi:MAG TPA: S1-like domain-containing RNA-binding protein [Bacillota bacterium]|nr:S1-like domain-containing RNA-binding protein [Bacillota bacterium]HPF42122.1 S1-like domain-containing RNA-binding protein [Bacillota bacterium]HPJ85351.1 S1-like domain-containing RNA-binding protein [Bacillota bacterium]HPQ61353.1 S1-like domain-containing RNA-binding protein [Bacillota bacterium]HRX91413.1 S1-like domain-containing RNA-binding protein [Candidatus Izemoplasmatales bacterium]
MTLQIGKTADLKVSRITDIAYILTNEKEEIFLHKKETGSELKPGDIVHAYIYPDSYGRICASAFCPFVELGTASFLKVKGVNYEYGVFLDNNQVKDLLLSKDDLPFDLDLWPQAGDSVFAVMTEKKGQLFAHIPGRKQITGFFKEHRELDLEKVIDAWVMFILPEGLVAFASEGQEIFIHKNNLRDNFRIGEQIAPRIVKKNSDNEYVASLIERKESMIDPDARTILAYLENHDGYMRYSDKSLPGEIESAFGMSKSAFKRAIGHLYREGRIVLYPDHTEMACKSKK